MASSIFLASHILLLILFHLLLVTEPTRSASIPTQTGFRANLTLVGSGRKSTKNQYSPNALNDAKDEVNNTPTTSLLTAFKDEYLMDLAIGTPPQRFKAVMDTGSDLTWTKCKPKTTTSSSSSFFDPSRSSSLSKVNQTCESFGLNGCMQYYKDGQKIAVTLSQDTLTIGNAKISNVIFGCGIPVGKNYPYSGTVGMGRGELSLVSKLDEHVFSYCLASRSDKLKRSVLITGSEASNAIRGIASRTKTKIQTMSLLKQGSDSYYHISLEGISMGGTRLPVTKSDFTINSGNNDGMVIIDSGTTFTSFPKHVFDAIKNEFMNQTKLVEKSNGKPPYKDLNLCFDSSYNREIIPKLVFHFDGADWELPRENYIYEQGRMSCLAIGVNENNDPTSVFGNFQQQNMMVLYDLDKNWLSFMPANCNEV